MDSERDPLYDLIEPLPITKASYEAFKEKIDSTELDFYLIETVQQWKKEAIIRERIISFSCCRPAPLTFLASEAVKKQEYFEYSLKTYYELRTSLRAAVWRDYSPYSKELRKIEGKKVDQVINETKHLVGWFR